MEMEDFVNPQYDYFGEFSSPEETYANSPVKRGTDAKSNSATAADDSLMEFISEYFRGDVTNNFSMIGQDETLPIKPNWPPEQVAVDEPKSLINPLNFTISSSDENTSLELFSSADSSLLSGSVDSLSLESHSDEDRASRRKSISYEIRFINSKEENGRVKICILPNMPGSPATPSPSMTLKVPSNAFPSKGKAKPNGQSESETLRYDNELLRAKLKVLERKLNCVEKESERVVGELKRIIERKNEVISQLELQVAGIDFMEGQA